MRNNLTRAMQLVGIETWNKMSSEERRNLLSGVKAKTEKDVIPVESEKEKTLPVEKPKRKSTGVRKRKTKAKTTTKTKKSK